MKIISRPSTLKSYGNLPDLSKKYYPLKELTEILSSYNERNVGEVKQCVVTGHQLGFMGGPCFTILKAISCLILARKLNATPIFWLATEDHDIGEIDHTYLLDELGNLKKYHIKLPKDGHFVEDLELTEENIDTINQFFSDLKMETLPVNSTSYTKVMSSFLRYLFRNTELLFIEPFLLRPLAKAFFDKEIEGQANLFYKNEKDLRKKTENKDLLKSLPLSRLSCNVYSRPVMQSFIIPTIAYVGGPNELNYYKELKSAHEYHGVPMPQLVPRMQATFIPEEFAKVLENCTLDPWEKIPVQWEEVFFDIGNLEKGEKKEFLKDKGLSLDSLHRLHNLITPKERPQERVLNWFNFQAAVDSDLVQELLKNNEYSGEFYCYL